MEQLYKAEHMAYNKIGLNADEHHRLAIGAARYVENNEFSTKEDIVQVTSAAAFKYALSFGYIKRLW